MKGESPLTVGNKSNSQKRNTLHKLKEHYSPIIIVYRIMTFVILVLFLVLNSKFDPEFILAIK